MMKTHKIYLGGPMTGLPAFNYLAFRKAAEELRIMGNEVFSPVEANDRRYGRDIEDSEEIKDENLNPFNLRETFLDNLTFICQEADTIALLPGWRNSKGALAEYAVALALGLTVIELTP